MKILINRKIINGPWGGGNNFVKSLHQTLVQNGHEVLSTLEPNIDLIVMSDPRYDELGISINEIISYKKYNKNVKILHRINECDARKNTTDIDQLLLASNAYADETVFISDWLKNYFIDKGFKNKYHTVYNGCNTDFFYPNINKKKLEKPYKIVTHHWSDNWMKGFDIYKKLDEICVKNSNNFEFTYIGRYAKEYTPVVTKVISPLFEKDLGNELRKHDIYITASRYEPCGMHHIEGASSGLPILYHSEGGGIVEGCKKHGISFSSVDDIENKLFEIIENYNKLCSSIDYDFLSMKRCMNQYMEIINNLLAKK